MHISTKNPAEMTGQERIDEIATLLVKALLRIVRSEKDLAGLLPNSERSYGHSRSKSLSFVHKPK